MAARTKLKSAIKSAARHQGDAQLANWPTEGLATIAAATTFLQCSRTTLYLLMNAGDLEYVMLHRERRLKWPSLRQYAMTGNGRLATTSQP